MQNSSVKNQPSFQQAGRQRVTAMTWAAAMEIGGATASEFHYMQNKSYATQDEIDSHKETRLNIIDEVSFAGSHCVSWTSHFLQKATECNEFQYGKAAMCFLGDFANLKRDKDTDNFFVTVGEQPNEVQW
jgi:hypothetical protein